MHSLLLHILSAYCPDILNIKFLAVTANMAGTVGSIAGHVIAVGLKGDLDYFMIEFQGIKHTIIALQLALCVYRIRVNCLTLQCL